MKPDQAVSLVARLANSYPGATFTEQNAAAYEREFKRLEHDRTQAAIDELVRTSRYLPTIAEINSEIIRAKREEARLAESKPPRIVDVAGRSLGPYPRAWAGPLDTMLAQQSRYEASARAWYASKGKRYPGDPGAKFVNVAVAGARGDDVAEVFERVVMP
jgi:hypothetical protein